MYFLRFCGKASVLTVSSQDKNKKLQRKSAFVGYGGLG